LRGESETVSLAEGKVLLNLVPLVNLALASIESVSSDLVGRDVTLPTFQPGEAASSEISKLEQALGIDLPDDYGQIPVYDSQDLEALQKTLYTAKRLLILLLVLIPVLVAAALLVSTRRRRTLVQLTVGAAIGLVVVRRVALIARDGLFDQVNTQRHPAVRVLADTLMDSLFRATGILLGIVLLTLLIALITGPYPWAVTVRGWLRDGARGIGSAVGGHPAADTDRVRWLRAHRDALMLAGGVVALLLLLLFNLSWLAFVIVTVVIALYEIALVRLGHEPEGAETA